MMNDRKLLSTWKEIATYVSRGVRTVQRWELNYGLPVHRPGNDAQSVYAFADEVDAWMQRARSKDGTPYVRPTCLVVDVATPNALSDLKLAIEAVKLNVLTAFSAAELFATARKYDVDAFVVDSVVLDVDPLEIGTELRRLYPSKLRLLIGDGPAEPYDASVPSGHVGAAVEWLIQKLGTPRLL